MARLQILELPEGENDSRPPFVLVVDESAPQRVIMGMDHGRVRDHWQDVADRIGARGAIVTAETVEIPANEVSLPDLRELVADAELRSERDEMRRNYDGACKTIAEMHVAATGREGMGPVRGVVEDVADLRQRAEAAEEKLAALGKQVTERMDRVTDALGFDRLRDWDEIVSAIRVQRQVAADGEHLFGEPGYQDPQRCARCGLGRDSWMRQRDTRRCSTVRTDAESGHEFRPIGARDELACLRCGMPRIEWAVRRDTPQCDVVRQGGE